MVIGQGKLAELFEGVGAKRLSRVDATPKSNQHEIGATKPMRDQFLGNEDTRFPAVYMRLAGEQEGMTEQGGATYYDTRKGKDRAAEFRLYYPSNGVTGAMDEGDTLFLAKHTNGTLWFIITPPGSPSEAQLSWLFGVAPKGKRFVSREVSPGEPPLDFAARFILDELGIEFEEPDADKLDTIIERHIAASPELPLPDLARQTLTVDATDDPDFALMAWLEHEEGLHRRLEHQQGESSVAGLAEAAVRVELSLKNHLEAVFRAAGLPFDRDARIDAGPSPDFLFPSAAAYASAGPETARRLMVLGVTPTCTGRWQQMRTIAHKIGHKHLATLEPRIAPAETDAMRGHGVQLVVPEALHASYQPPQRRALWTVAEFVDEARSRFPTREPVMTNTA